MANNYQKEQAQNITATPQELDAWEALRREPGLMGRLARRGKHMKRDYVGGRRSFNPNEDKTDETTNVFGNPISGATQRAEHQRVRDEAGPGGSMHQGEPGGEQRGDGGAAERAAAAAAGR